MGIGRFIIESLSVFYNHKNEASGVGRGRKMRGVTVGGEGSVGGSELRADAQSGLVLVAVCIANTS